MKTLVATGPAHPLYYPIVPLAWALRAAGHEVLVAAPESFEGPVRGSGLPMAPVYGPLDPVARELVVPIGDADATAMAIRRALDLGPDERARLGSRLRDFVIATADYDTHMRRMEGLYRRLAAAR